MYFWEHKFSILKDKQYKTKDTKNQNRLDCVRNSFYNKSIFWKYDNFF